MLFGLRNLLASNSNIRELKFASMKESLRDIMYLKQCQQNNLKLFHQNYSLKKIVFIVVKGTDLVLAIFALLILISVTCIAQFDLNSHQGTQVIYLSGALYYYPTKENPKFFSLYLSIFALTINYFTLLIFKNIFQKFKYQIQHSEMDHTNQNEHFIYLFDL